MISLSRNLRASILNLRMWHEDALVKMKPAGSSPPFEFTHFHFSTYAKTGELQWEWSLLSASLISNNWKTFRRETRVIDLSHVLSATSADWKWVWAYLFVTPQAAVPHFLIIPVILLCIFLLSCKAKLSVAFYFLQINTRHERYVYKEILLNVLFNWLFNRSVAVALTFWGYE